MTLSTQIYALRDAGWTLARIGKRVRMHPPSIQYYLNNRARGLPEGRGRNTHNRPLPTPDEISAALVEAREADRAARTAVPPPSPDRRRERMNALHPLVRGAVLPTPGRGSVEGWAEED